MQLLEYSDEVSAPIANYDKSDVYYAGPANYMVETRSGYLTNVNTGATVSKVDFAKIDTELKTMIAKPKVEVMSTETELTVDNTASTDSTESLDPGPTGPGTVGVEDYTVLNRRYVADYRYFLAKPDHGDNLGRTCGSVATQLLLSYNNWVNDGRLITNSDFLRATKEEIIASENIYSNSAISTTSAYNTGDAVTTFYEYLISKIDPEQNGTQMSDIANGIGLYLNDYVPTSIHNEYVFSHYGPLINVRVDQIIAVTKSEIDNNRPLLNSIWHYERNDETNEIERDGHVVVTYGYQTFLINGSQVGGFIAHYGWLDHHNVWFNESWVKGYLTMQATHQHTDVLVKKGHIVQCSTCNRVSSNTYHMPSRITKKGTLVNVLYVIDEQYHKATCYCGYSYDVPHNGYYEYVNSNYHILSCTDCGLEVQQAHQKQGVGCVCM